LIGVETVGLEGTGDEIPVDPLEWGLTVGAGDKGIFPGDTLETNSAEVAAEGEETGEGLSDVFFRGVNGKIFTVIK
jgi:hypothetical protein